MQSAPKKESLTCELDELMAVQILSPILLNNRPYLPMSSWSTSFQAIAHIANDLIINQRKCFIEFGSGVSTILLARLIQLNKMSISFISIDQNPDWISLQNKLLQQEGLDKFVEFVYAPIVKSTYNFKSHVDWFCADTLNKNLAGLKFDSVFVDAPIGDSPYTRYGAFPFLQDKLDDNFSIFLDDTNRFEEQEIAIQWHERSPDSTIQFFNSYAHIRHGKYYGTYPLCIKGTSKNSTF